MPTDPTPSAALKVERPEESIGCNCPDCGKGRLIKIRSGEWFCDSCEVEKSVASRTSLPNLFAVMLPKLRVAAFKLGYTLALHGSMARDFDLIAVPWIEKAADAEAVAEAILLACDGYVVEQREGRDPTLKPHGRKAWSIHLAGHWYIDLSVMPKQTGVTQ